MKIDEIIEMLSSGERKLLEVLCEYGKMMAEEIAGRTGMDLVTVSRNAMWLENKNLAKIEKKPYQVYDLSDLGRRYLETGLPERRVYNFLEKKTKASLSEIMKSLGLDRKEINAIVGFFSKNKIARIMREGGELYLVLENKDDSVIKRNEETLNNIAEKKVYNEETARELAKRKILRRKTLYHLIITLTPEGKDVCTRIKEQHVEYIELITRDVIESREWENKPFRKYDIFAPVPKIYGGRLHPLTWVMNMVREAFISMGFEEYEGPWIETSFWNMDSMFIPQHHPARDVQDTFYLDEYGELPDSKLISKIKAVHENGWKTGSMGYGMRWDPEIAKKLVLRSHTTALTYRLLARGVKPPIKVFSIGRVFRNETPDPLHLPEFHQIEGFVYAKGLTLRHLMGYLKTFYAQFGIKKLRFKPTYNPYTEPSMEIYAYNPAMKKWVEIANSGVFRPESVMPYGIKYNIIAWGLAVERLAGLLFTIRDIRDLIGSRCDFDFIRGYPYREVKLGR